MLGRLPGADAGPAPVPDGPSASLPAPYGLLPGILSLRLTLRSRPMALARRTTLAAAGSGTGFLLLAAAAGAAADPPHASAALTRLAWCAVPLAAVTRLAVAVHRADPLTTAVPDLTASGLGPARLPRLAAAQAAAVCVMGSLIALAVFLRLRGHLTGTAALPAAAMATLLALVPLAASVGCLVALRPRRREAVTVADTAWCVAVVVLGLAAELYGRAPAHHTSGALVMPGGLPAITPGALLGWALVLSGPVFAGPGLVHLTGRLLSAHRPGALRLLCGRGLQAEATLIGGPLGALSSTVCAALSALALRAPGARPPGPLTLLASAVILVCVLGAPVAAAARARQARAQTAAVLSTLGASRRLLRGSVALRVVALTVLFLPLTAVLAWLSVPPHG